MDQDIEKDKRLVIQMSQEDRKLAEDKLADLAKSPREDYFCVEEEEEDIDIKIEVVPSLQDMGIELFDGEMPRILPNSPIGEVQELSNTYEQPPHLQPEAGPSKKPRKRREKSDKPKPFACPICQSVGVERSFDRPSILKAHILYHKKTGRAILSHSRHGDPTAAEKEQIYTCETCHGRQFTSRKAFVTHRSFHKFLIKKYGQDRPVAQGTRNVIPIQDVYNCTTCGKEFEDRPKFLAHLKGHRKRGDDKNYTPRSKIPYADEYKCDKCEKVYPGSSRVAYRLHLRRHKELEEGGGASTGRRTKPLSFPFADEYKCDKCDKVYPGTSRDAYRYHVRRHKELDEVEEKRKQRLARLRPDIPMQDSYHCDMCDRDFSDREKYVNHVRYHEELERKGINRPIAEKKERDQNADEEEEGEEGEFFCEKCDKHFTNQRSRFNGHMKYHAQLQALGKDRVIGTWETGISWKDKIPHGLDTYTCETCPNRSFDTRSSYLTHLIIHRNLKRKGCDRPIYTKEEWAQKVSKRTTCDLCDDKPTFDTVRDYNKHEREVHPGPAREPTTSWKDLIPEQDIYTCEICIDRTFTDRPIFIGHVRLHKSLARRGEDRPIMSREQFTESRKGKPPREIKPRFTCATCDKSFWKRVTYRSHMRYHDILKRKGEDRVIGEKKKSWKELVPFQDHYTCDKCPDRGFDEREAYVGHLAYHRLLERKGKAKSSIPLTRRKDGARGTVKERKCRICDRTFDDYKSYQGHMDYHRKIRKKTGQDRPIGKKNEEAATPIKAGNVLDLVAEMMEDLNRFGCACGDKFYFKDALLHHLTLGTSEICGEIEVKIKQEVVEEETQEDESGEVFFCDDDSSPKEDVEMKLAPAADADVTPKDNPDNESSDEDLFSELVQKNPNNLSSTSLPKEEIEVEVELEHVAVVEGHIIAVVEPESEIFEPQVEINQVEIIQEGDTTMEEEDKGVGLVQIVSPGSSLFQSPEEGGEEDMEEDEKDPMAAFYQCQTCHADSDSLTGYLRHQYQLHLIDNASQLPCPFCGVEFKLGSELFIHCKEEHGEISPVEEFTLPCPSCEVVLEIRDGSEMEQHFKKEHPKVVCRMCGKMVSALMLLNKHIVSEHLKKKK